MVKLPQKVLYYMILGALVEKLLFPQNVESGHLGFAFFDRNRWFASLVPARFGFSIPKNPQVQIFMLSAGSEHLFTYLLDYTFCILYNFLFPS